ncbi:uncharacterized protein SAPINGB_P001437 [Magnusiomyces paraingens]|uniref:NADP-dependent oxidoreductase domain-containing protein n=1 Tax=Magnusiomyces paraingens TaxID=2606893 RepID=A0A5E8BBV6_9ASCO|nr:uncharacterized protein SAPINGB_P001437 [Saprochaete ingens]VVT46887.1 unnamed protein product [Saprochaete ingens]
MTIQIPTATLNNGIEIPLLAFGAGTIWNKPRVKRLTGIDLPEINQATVTIVLEALRSGHRHIDTAEVYETETEVGLAIAQFLQETPGISRKDLFVTTKIFKHASDPAAALDASLKRLGLEYVDLYLIHKPELERFGTSVNQVWPKLEEAYRAGKTRAIGVSNFSTEQLDNLVSFAQIKPAVNQIEHHPYFQERTPGIVEYAKTHGILLEAFGPLGAITLPDYATAPLTPILDRLAAKYHKTPAQISLRWTVQNGILPVTTTSRPERVAGPLHIFDFELTSAEVAEISQVGQSFAYRKFVTLTKELEEAQYGSGK